MTNWEKHFGSPENAGETLSTLCEIAYANDFPCALYTARFCLGIECSVGVRDKSFAEWLQEECDE